MASPPEVVKPNGALRFGSKEFDPLTYSQVTQMARLVDVRLIESMFKLDPMYIDHFSPEGPDYTLSFEGRVASYGFDAENGNALGTYAWTADAKVGNRKIVKLKAVFLVVYGELENSPEQYVRLYFSKIARFTTYPYFRSHTANSMSSAGLIFPPLPSLTERVD